MAENPIKSSQLYVDEGDIDRLIKQLEEANTAYTKLADNTQKKAITLSASLDKMNVSQKEGQEAIAKTFTEAQRLNKANKDYKKGINDTSIEIKELKREQRAIIKQKQLEIKLNKSAEGSYDKLSAQYSLNKIALNKMSAEQRKATKEGQELEQETKRIFEEMKSLQEATGKTSLNVGNYADALSDTNRASARAVGGVRSFKGALDLIKAHPVIAVLGVFISLLTGIFALFKRTSKGAEIFTAASGALQGVLSVLTGVVDRLFTSLMNAFSNPKEAIINLWNTIRDNLVNRFEGFVKLINTVGRALKALWNRDFTELKIAVEEVGSALVQMSTGLDEKQQKNFAKSIVQTTKAVRGQIKAFADLATERRKVNRLNRETERSIQKVIQQEELQRAIADDATKSFKEREEAAQKASEATIKRSKGELLIAERNLSLLNKELELRKSNGEEIEDLADQQLEAFKQLSEAEKNYSLSVRENEKQRSELKQDRLERDLDILIDGFDNQKTINERLLQDDRLTLDRRKEIFEDTAKLANESFEKQIETITKFTNANIDANDLINESDAVALNQKIRSLGLSEIIEGRLLEIIRERRIAVQDLNEAEKDLTDKRKEEAKRQLENQIKAIDEAKELEESRIDTLDKTEKEKTRLQTIAERDRQRKILAIMVNAGDVYTDAQIQKVKNTITALNKEIDDLSKEDKKKKSIWEALGLDLGEGEKRDAANEALNSAADFISSKFFEIADARVQAAEIAVAAIEREIEAQQRLTDSARFNLNTQLQLAELGLAANIEQAERELQIANERENTLEAQREKAEKKREKAVRAQQRLDTIAQTGSLITAAANIYKALSAIGPIGVGLAKGVIAAMFGAFTLAKVQAGQITKSQEFGEGGEFEIGGGTHASGNDTSLGVHNGKNMRVQRGEKVAIFNHKANKKYGSQLSGIIEGANRLKLEESLNAVIPGMASLPQGEVYNNIVFDHASITKELKGLREDGRRKPKGVETTYLPDGTRIEKKGNRTRTIRPN